MLHYTPMKNTQVVIMAGGKGTRMDSELPKVLVPVLGKPMVRHTVEMLQTLSMPHKPILVIGHEADLVKNEFGDEVAYAYQAEQLGTAHAVQTALPLLDDGVEHVVVLNGDHPFVSPETIQRLVNTQKQNSGPLTLATVLVHDDDEFQKHFYALGRVVRDNNGQIKEIVEKKDATPDQLEIREINPQYWCFDRDWLEANITKVDNNNAAEEYYLPSLLLMAFEQGHQIGSYVTEDSVEACGINTREQLEAIEERFK